jgi:hypothetical protein
MARGDRRGPQVEELPAYRPPAPTPQWCACKEEGVPDRMYLRVFVCRRCGFLVSERGLYAD